MCSFFVERLIAGGNEHSRSFFSPSSRKLFFRYNNEENVIIGFQTDPISTPRYQPSAWARALNAYIKCDKSAYSIAWFNNYNIGNPGPLVQCPNTSMHTCHAQFSMSSLFLCPISKSICTIIAKYISGFLKKLGFNRNLTFEI